MIIAPSIANISQLGDRDDLVGFFRYLDLAKHEALAGCESRNHVDGGFAGALDRRTVLPSMAITPAGMPVKAAI